MGKAQFATSGGCLILQRLFRMADFGHTNESATSIDCSHAHSIVLAKLFASEKPPLQTSESGLGLIRIKDLIGFLKDHAACKCRPA